MLYILIPSHFIPLYILLISFNKTLVCSYKIKPHPCTRQPHSNFPPMKYFTTLSKTSFQKRDQDLCNINIAGHSSTAPCFKCSHVQCKTGHSTMVQSSLYDSIHQYSSAVCSAHCLVTQICKTRLRSPRGHKEKGHHGMEFMFILKINFEGRVEKLKCYTCWLISVVIAHSLVFILLL